MQRRNHARHVIELAPDCQRLVVEFRGDGVVGVIDGPEAGRVERLCTQGRGWSLNRFEECVKPVARLRWIAMQEPEPAERASQAQADVKRFGVAAIQTPTQGLAEVILLALESRGDGRFAGRLHLWRRPFCELRVVARVSPTYHVGFPARLEHG